MISKLRILLCCIVSVYQLSSQSFDIEQATQLIRPRLKLDSKYNFDANFKDTMGTYNGLENSVGVTFPIKRSFKTEVALNLKSLKIKDILKNSLRIKANEILGTFRVSNRQIQLGYDSVPNKSLNYANAGIIGLHLTKKYRLLFYSANITIHEQTETLKNTMPRFSAVVGQYHIRGFRKSFYYGATLVYSDGLLIPVPFIGGTEPIGKHFLLNYTLPVQLNIQYHKNKSFANIGIKADGYRSGIKYQSKRTNISYTQANVFVNYRHKFSNTFQMQLEGGYSFFQNIQYDKPSVHKIKYPINGSPTVNLSLNVFFGKSLLEKIVEQLF